MKLYKGPRKLDAICEAMTGAGMTIDKTGLEKGGDCCQLRGGWYDKPLTIEYNIVNGQFDVFNGFTGELIATNVSEDLEGEEWYAKLLEALYEPLDA